MGLNSSSSSLWCATALAGRPSACATSAISSSVLGRNSRSGAIPGGGAPARAPIGADHVAPAHGDGPSARGDVEALGPVVDLQGAAAGDAAAAHAAGDNGGVGGHPAARGEDAGGGLHAVDVL